MSYSMRRPGRDSHSHPHFRIFFVGKFCRRLTAHAHLAFGKSRQFRSLKADGDAGGMLYEDSISTATVVCTAYTGGPIT